MDIQNAVLVEEYLDNLWGNKQLKDLNKNKAKIHSSDLVLKIEQQLRQGVLKLNKEVGNIDDLLYVVDKQTGKFDLVEMKIKEAQLKEKKRQQEELESKLLNLQLNIKELDNEKKHFGSPDKFLHKANHIGGDFESSNSSKIYTNLDLKKLGKERKLLEQKRQENFKELEKRIEEEKKKEEEEKKLAREKEIEERKKKAIQNIEKLKKEQEERQKILELEQQKIKEIHKQTPLYVKFEKIYEKQENNILDQKKKELAIKRNLGHPMDHENYKEHEKKHQEELEKIKQRNQRGPLDQFDIKKFYKSKFYNQQESEIKNQKSSLDNEKINIRQKMLEYVEQKVQKPTIDENKKKELERQIKELHKPIHKRRKRAESQEQIESEEENEEDKEDENKKNSHTLGLDYLKFNKEHGKKKNQIENENKVQPEMESRTIDVLDKAKNKKKSSRSHRSDQQKNSSSQQNIFVKHDYLKEMQQQRGNIGVNQSIDKKQWEKVLNKQNITKEEKQMIILQEAEKLETKAHRMEKLRRVQNKISGENEEDVDELYIQAIKAKLSLLEN